MIEIRQSPDVAMLIYDWTIPQDMRGILNCCSTMRAKPSRLGNVMDNQRLDGAIHYKLDFWDALRARAALPTYSAGGGDGA